MRYIILFYLGIIIFLFINAGKKQKEEIPPGTIAINDTLFADETEISNFSWLEFTLSIKRKYGINSPEYRATLPDTLVWENKDTYNLPYVYHYFRNSAFRDYPVVGISYEQALAFCKWRTEQVNYFISVGNKRQVMHPDSNFKGTVKYEYRLPTKQEWESFAIIGNNKRKETNYNRKGIEKKYLYNLITDDIRNILTEPVYSFFPNKLGLYNLKGNVSEMLLEKGVAKGGSWCNTESESFFLNNFKYTKPTATVGFRCVCVKR